MKIDHITKINKKTSNTKAAKCAQRQEQANIQQLHKYEQEDK